MSEFSFYPFRGGFDPHDDSTPSFEEWLAERYPERTIVVRNHPTIDFQAIPAEILNSVASDIKTFLQSGKTVVLVDSGGETRTGYVCRYLGLQEKFG